jgi:hypothetical protein
MSEKLVFLEDKDSEEVRAKQEKFRYLAIDEIITTERGRTTGGSKLTN